MTMAHQTPDATPVPPAYQAEIEYLPRPELDIIRQHLLARAVRRAQQAPFYRERLQVLPAFGDTLSPELFQQYVPLTTKDDLRRMGCTAWTETETPTALVLSTSGTTGTRVALPYTLGDLQRWFDLVARTLWANAIRPHDVVLLPVPLGLFSGGQGMFGGLQRLGCTVLPIGIVHTPVMAELLHGGLGVTPTAIITLPSHMLRLLDTLPAAGCDPASAPLRVGSFGAEAWSEAARIRIEEGFGLRAYDSYGIGELCGPGVAAECERRDGMHIWEDAFFPEVIDPATGDPVPDGTPGELVLSSLFRERFPLLRYRTGDEVSLLPEHCACGRTHRRMTRIARRLDDVLIVTGINIHPGDIERILYGFPWLGHEYYLAAGGEHHDVLCIHVERKAGIEAPPAWEQNVIEAVRRAYPVRVSVHCYEAGQLERAPGKAQRIRGA